MSVATARAFYRRLYWLPRDLLSLHQARWPQHLIYFGGKGFGDDLLLTSVATELHRAGIQRIAVITRLTELFDRFPFPVTVLSEARWGTLNAMLRWGRPATKPHYYRGFQAPDTDVIGPHHIIAEMCLQAGLHRSVELRPYLYLTEAERARGRRVENQAVIQTTTHLSDSPSRLKFWIAERYQEVVDQNRDRLNFVQLGSAGDPPLRGVLDLRGQTGPRESAAVLAASRLHLGYVGFLMHLARAVECPGVIVFGGRERPDQSGYACNENLFTELPCSPCWHRTTCDFDRECMRRIRGEDVTQAITRLLARPSGPLVSAFETV